MRTIAIINQKGGCGKTTVSINLASALAELGQRVLLVDMDPQSHCAVGLAVPEDQVEQSIYDVLISNIRNEPLKLTEILWQISDRFELAPSSIDLSAFEQQMAGISDRERCLENVLNKVKKEFDYTIIDCPPAVSILTFNAIRAATDVIVPVETGYFALHGLSKQLETLDILCKRNHQQINVRVVASMYDIRTKMAREILSELKSHFGEKMFKTIVNFNTKIKEASSFGQPVSEYASTSKGQRDFRALAEEVMSSEVKQQQREMVNSLAGQLEAISASADELLQSTKTEVALPVVETVDSQADISQYINASADELLEPAKPEIQAVEASKSPIPAVPAAADTETKLSDYYGVSQVHEAIVFVTLYPHAKSVQVAGEFNNWQPKDAVMEKVGNSGVWQTKLNIPKGKYRYRLVVDGQWQQDPYNGHVEMNPFGDFNSVLEVQ